jgi:hypothetical protein
MTMDICSKIIRNTQHMFLFSFSRIKNSEIIVNNKRKKWAQMNQVYPILPKTQQNINFSKKKKKILDDL